MTSPRQRHFDLSFALSSPETQSVDLPSLPTHVVGQYVTGTSLTPLNGNDTCSPKCSTRRCLRGGSEGAPSGWRNRDVRSQSYSLLPSKACLYLSTYRKLSKGVFGAASMWWGVLSLLSWVPLQGKDLERTGFLFWFVFCSADLTFFY